MLDTERKEPVPEGEKSLAERWQKRIKYFDEQHEERRKRWKENRTYVDGTPGEDGSAGLVRVNLTQSTLNTIQPAIYAKAPDVAVTPAERLDAEEYKPVKAVAKVSELVLKKEAIERGRLKVKGKAAVRASLTATTGWVWVYYETKTKKDPIVLGRLNDLQDNITRVNTLIAETADESKCGDYRAKLEELSHAQAGLQAQSEVTIATGIVMDSVAPDDVLIMDDSIKSIDDIAQASAIARRVRITVANYRDRFGKEPPKGTKKYERDSEADKKGQADQDDVMVDVWEIWCHDDLTVYTLPAGSNEWAREPFQPQVLGEQWYPAFPLQLNRVDGVLYPRCRVDNLRELVDEYNARRTKSREHRRKNNPIRVFRKDSGLTDAELKALNQAGATTDFVGLSGNPSEPIQAAIGSLEAIPFDPMMYDTSDILRDIEMTSGAQDAARGGMVEAKTATEAEIMAQGNQSKASEALDVLEDWLTEILRYS